MTTLEKDIDSFLDLPENVRQAAAAMLIRAALVDRQFGDSERIKLFSALQHQFNILPAQAEKLIRDAASLSSQRDNIECVAILNSHTTTSQREYLLTIAWAIIAADSVASREETSFAATLRSELGLPMEAALRARKHAESIFIDGFKEIVEGDPAAAAMLKPGAPRPRISGMLPDE